MTFVARWPRLGRVNGLHVVLPNKFDHFGLLKSFACHLRGEDRQWKPRTCPHRMITGNSEVERDAVISATQIWPHLADQRGLSTALTSREFANGFANRGGKARQRLRMPQVKGLRTQTGECSQPEAAPSNCGFSYSKFVRKCSDWLTDRQLERVAVRLKAYKALKKAPRAHNKLAVIRDIGKIVPKEHQAELTKLLSESLDLVDPHHFLRLSKASAERIYTKRIGEFVVDWKDPSIPEAGSRSKNLVFLSNLPHAPRDVLTDCLCKAFSGCGKIKRVEIFDDRLRTLDQTEDNTMQAKGEKAISDKLEKRFSPIFALAEFSCVEEKQKACSTYLRTFGVPCIDRLVYPEDAAVKTTLIATNLPFVLTADEIARILAFALVYEADTACPYPGGCRLRMTNPRLFGYEHVFVEARSDTAEPFFVLPPHKKGPDGDVDGIVLASGSVLHDQRKTKPKISQYPVGNSQPNLFVNMQRIAGDNTAEVDLAHSTETRQHAPLAALGSCTASIQQNGSHAAISATLDENIFIPVHRSPIEVENKNEIRKTSDYSKNNFDLGRHVVKKLLMNRLVLNNDGMFVLRFASFEAAEAAVRKCRGAVIYDSKALLLFSPRRCVYHNGQLVDFVIPEGNFAIESKNYSARA
ncbi:hypothetical protein, conserved [Eimeria necatrix]|uniref:Uncharacterized protein n=1 Tax=Eimeria necatrix TaxID=51315 RepID=U6MY42_9EIME|nr:hypothetical protein, conserved [Eimeria necatrix]CDJ69152.1 hypothetical protein, conserved [Eimeria necatrix]